LENQELEIRKNEISNENLEVLEKAVNFQKAALSENTNKTYRHALSHFQKWCQEKQLSYFPTSAETLALYLSDISEGKSISTLKIKKSAIEKFHKKAGKDILGDRQIYKDVLQGIKRIFPEKSKQKQAKPISVFDIQLFCKHVRKTCLKEVRNKAIILIGFFGGLRQSEIVSFDIEDIEVLPEGIRLFLKSSKTSLDGSYIYISPHKNKEMCPVAALNNWMRLSDKSEGPLFLSMKKNRELTENRVDKDHISRIVKWAFGSEYSGHSLRRGVITALADKGLSIHDIQKISRHKSADMILRYSEKKKGFELTASQIL
jgi:site-specific recombinase XerD